MTISCMVVRAESGLALGNGTPEPPPSRAAGERGRGLSASQKSKMSRWTAELSRSRPTRINLQGGWIPTGFGWVREKQEGARGPSLIRGWKIRKAVSPGAGHDLVGAKSVTAKGTLQSGLDSGILP